VAPSDSVAPAGARNPAYAADGRLALTIRGDIWIRSSATADARWLQVTSGPEWDRQPVWSADGTSIIYASNISGDGDLYRVAIGPTGASAAPERITSASEPESDPSIAPD
jgi:Tol biopolymer transport system component